MTQLVLTRDTSNSLRDATMGEITLDGHHLCWSMELPWRDNEHANSCIPPGVYALGHHWREIGGMETLILSPTEPRAGILIHVANWPSQIEGCIAVGQDKYEINGHCRLIRSAKAMRQVLDAHPTSILIRWDAAKVGG